MNNDIRPSPEDFRFSRRPKFLMCAPLYYDVTERINVHMNPDHAGGRPDRDRAWKEWMTLLETLVSLGAEVEVMPQHPGLEDMVFTANAGIVVGEKDIILATFKHNRRKPEQALFEDYFCRRGYRIRKFTFATIFEGQGDALWWGNDLIMSYGFRSQQSVSWHAREYFSETVIPMKLADPRWYHGDTALCPISDKLLMWYPSAFSASAQKRLVCRAKEKGAELLPVTESEALAFVCNAIPVGKSLVIPNPPKGSTIMEKLRAHGITPVPVCMDNFLLSGGAARCLVLNLNRIHR